MSDSEHILHKIEEKIDRVDRHAHDIEHKLDMVLRTLADLTTFAARVESTLALIQSQQEKLMALADDLKKSIADLDVETSAIAANITNLVSKIKNSMSDQEVADIKAGFSTLGDRLNILGQDPLAPVPPPPPPLQALRGKKV